MDEKYLAEDAKVEACADHVGVEDAVAQEDHEQLALVRVPVVPATGFKGLKTGQLQLQLQLGVLTFTFTR